MGILHKANTLRGASTLVMGRHAEGKTTQVVKAILEDEGSPLWVSFTNITPLVENRLEWDVALPSTWQEFETEIYAALVTGEIDPGQYDTIVLDGLNVAATMLLGSKPQITQADYRNMGLKMQGIVAKLRGMFPNIYIVIDIVDNAEGDEQLAINRDLFNQLASLFGRKWFTYATPAKGGGIEYSVQDNPTLAVRFRPVKK